VSGRVLRTQGVGRLVACWYSECQKKGSGRAEESGIHDKGRCLNRDSDGKRYGLRGCLYTRTDAAMQLTYKQVEDWKRLSKSELEESQK
jgi:hypothetical protein